MGTTYERAAAPVQCLPSIENPKPEISSFQNSTLIHMDKGRAKILVVEDYQPMREMVSDVLSLYGHYVMGAENGLEAFDLFLKEKVDAVVTDLVMPEMDGWDLARQIKIVSPFTPVLAMTAMNRHEVADRMDNEAVDSVVFKPFMLTDLLSAVRSMIEAAR